MQMLQDRVVYSCYHLSTCHYGAALSGTVYPHRAMTGAGVPGMRPTADGHRKFQNEMQVRPAA
jgi:hypothetical protein